MKNIKLNKSWNKTWDLAVARQLGTSSNLYIMAMRNNISQSGLSLYHVAEDR